MYREMYTDTKAAPYAGTASVASLDEKQLHYSIRFLPAAGFNYSPSLRNRMFDRHRNPPRFRQVPKRHLTFPREPSLLQNGWCLSERLKKSTGVIEFGRKTALIPSLHSMK
jgi:hypothetical protein